LPILLSSLVPHPLDRIFAVPVGIALACLGYALWSERRAQAADPDDGVLTGVGQSASVVASNGRVPSKV
jgi:hypothetical protein